MTQIQPTPSEDPFQINKKEFRFFHDFLTSAPTTAGGLLSATLTNSGTASTIGPLAVDTNHPGVLALSTVTNSLGGACVATTSGTTFLGNGPLTYEICIYIPTLSDGTETYAASFGMLDSFNSINYTDSCYFHYDTNSVGTSAAASANWQLATTQGSTRSFQTSAIPVASASWTVLRIEANAAGTSADFYVNDVLAGTQAAQMPNANTKAFAFAANLQKSAGTTARTVSLDYMGVRIRFTTPR